MKELGWFAVGALVLLGAALLSGDKNCVLGIVALILVPGAIGLALIVLRFITGSKGG